MVGELNTGGEEVVDMICFLIGFTCYLTSTRPISMLPLVVLELVLLALFLKWMMGPGKKRFGNFLTSNSGFSVDGLMVPV